MSELDYIGQLEEEIEVLKKQLGVGEEQYEDLVEEKEELKSLYDSTILENQELKKQLENCYCNRTDCSARIKDSKQYDSLVQKIEKQQKEFIVYLENKQKQFDVLGDPINSGACLGILREYKEIIGVKDE